MGNIALSYGHRCAADRNHQYVNLVVAWPETSIDIYINKAYIETTASGNQEDDLPGITHNRFVPFRGMHSAGLNPRVCVGREISYAALKSFI